MSYINKRRQRVNEGELRCEALVRYLEETNSPKIVWISEDGTGIVPRISYENSSRKLVGLVLPIELKTGMPIVDSFIPQNAEDIAVQMNGTKSTTAYIIMAQPIKEGVAPFVLQIFGTDNTFKTEHMFHRWIHTKQELSK